MAIDPSVVVNIAAQWTGNKAFKQADTATDKLNRGVKSLGKSLGLALSVGAVLAFGKAAVKAAAEDEKAQKQLALAKKMLGLVEMLLHLKRLSKSYNQSLGLWMTSFVQLINL